MSEPTHILEYQGASFFKIPYVYSSQFRVNGSIDLRDIPDCHGDRSWKQFDGKIKSLEAYYPAKKRLIHYKLRAEYVWTKDRFPETVSPDCLVNDDEWGLSFTETFAAKYSGISPTFYEAGYEEPPGEWRSVEILVIDRDCKPVKRIPGVYAKFPHHLIHYPETHHKYPCYMDYETVFNYLHDKVEEIVKASDGKYTMTDYKNIQTLTVSEVIKLAAPKTETKEYYPSLSFKKKSKREVTYITRTVEVFSIRGKYQDGDAPRTIQIEGSNYEDFLKNLDSYVASFTDKLTKSKRQECPHCKGFGLVEI